MELKQNNNNKIAKFLELRQDRNIVFRRKHAHLRGEKADSRFVGLFFRRHHLLF